MKFFIETLGCQFSFYDSNRIKAILGRLKHSETPNLEEADLFILNACAVQEKSEVQALNTLRRIGKNLRQNTRVGVIGCMITETMTDPPFPVPLKIADVIQPDFVISAKDFPSLENILPRLFPEDPAGDLSEPEKSGNSLYVGVPVTEGCSEFCTYCIVPFRRGTQNSRHPDQVLKEVRSFVSGGARVITLLGQNLLGYEYSLIGLVEAVNTIPEVWRIYFSSFNPRYFKTELVDLFRLEKVCPFLRIPVQSGNNEILHRMGRKYTVEDCVNIVEALRKKAAGIAISTDFIVGFPGETESQFEDTVLLAQKMRLDGARVAAYSPRTGTKSFIQFSDDIPADEKNRRKNLLDKIVERSVLQNNRSLIGQTVEILCETSNHAESVGRTASAKKVIVKNSNVQPGQLTRVLVTRAEAWTLYSRRIEKRRSSV